MEVAIQFEDLFMAVAIAIPAYTTNAVPILTGGGISIDLGKNFIDGQRIFGSHKTVRGFAGGLLAGAFAAVLEALMISRGFFLLALLASLGALLGDLGGAFLKRRLRIAPGRLLPIVDQLDFITGSVLLISPFYDVSTAVVIVLLLVTPPLHLLANIVAYLLKIKSAFW